MNSEREGERDDLLLGSSIELGDTALCKMAPFFFFNKLAKTLNNLLPLSTAIV